jgi:PBP1b-binding outer membrane lipoprotein LpoB
MMMRRMLTVAALAMLLAGCRQSGPDTASPQPGPELTNAVPAKTTAQEVINGLTGKTAVDAGMKTKERIKNIREKADKDVQEVLQP